MINFELTAVFFIFGAVIGSFLNVVIFRFGTGRGLSGRSACMNCGRGLRWFELLPVFSFFLQGGRCRACGSRISFQYPAVEAATGVVFAAVFAQGGDILSTLFFLINWSLLILIFVYDLKHKIIPDAFVFPFIILSLIRVLILPHDAAWLWTELLAGPILFLPFFGFWYFSRGRLMGFADGKLALGIGWFLGLASAINITLLAFWIGAAVSLILLAAKKVPVWRGLPAGLRGLTIKSEIPFAPFMVVGAALVFFTSINVLPPLF